MSEWDQFPKVSDRHPEIPKVPGSNEWDQFPKVDRKKPGIGDYAGALSRSGLGAAMEGGGLVGGAILGGKMGAPFFPPWGAGIGAALGGTAGLLGIGSPAREIASSPEFPGGAIAERSVEGLPPELRPAGFAGEVLGGGSTIAAAPLALANQAGKSIPFVNKILQTAARSPAAFASVESLGLGGAALGEAGAETVAPGETGTRMVAGAGTGFLAPGRIPMMATRGVSKAARRLMESFSKGAKETTAAEMLQGVTFELGEDPMAIAAGIRASRRDVTPAQATGSNALTMLERKVAQDNPLVGSRMREQANAAMRDLQNEIAALGGNPAPDSLHKVAQARQRYFNTLMEGRVEIATQEAAEAATRISADTPSSRTVLSARTQFVIEDSMRDARKVESELYAAVPRAEGASLVSPDEIPDGLLGTYQTIRQGRLRAKDELSDVVDANLRLMADPEAPPPTVGELLTFRSRMLDMARKAGRDGDFRDEREFYQLADATLVDLEANLSDKGIEAYNTARQFSREMHDAYTRSFAGQAMQTQRTGAERIPPEVLLRRAFAGGGELAEVQFGQLSDAMDFLPRRGLGGEEAIAAQQEVNSNLNRMLRLIANEAVDPQTSLVKTGKLANFLKKEEGLLNRFPDIREDLQRALTSEKARQDVVARMKQARSAIDTKAAFGKIAGYENPASAVADALRSKKPTTEMGHLAKLAKRGGHESVEGLREATFEHLIAKSTNQQGDLDFARLKQEFATSPAIKALQGHGVMDSATIESANHLVDEAIRISRAATPGASLTDLVDPQSALAELILRVQGSRLGAHLPAGQAHPLIIHSAGSKFLRQFMDPSGSVSKIFERAAMDKEFAAMLLEKPTSAARRADVSKYLNAYLLQYGLVEFAPEKPEPELPRSFTERTGTQEVR